MLLSAPLLQAHPLISTLKKPLVSLLTLLKLQHVSPLTLPSMHVLTFSKQIQPLRPTLMLKLLQKLLLVSLVMLFSRALLTLSKQAPLLSNQLLQKCLHFQQPMLQINTLNFQSALLLQTLLKCASTACSLSQASLHNLPVLPVRFVCHSPVLLQPVDNRHSLLAILLSSATGLANNSLALAS
jgi:hypothetical protein